MQKKHSSKSKPSTIDGIAQRNRRTIGDFNNIQRIKTNSFEKTSSKGNRRVGVQAQKQAFAEAEEISEEDVIESTRSDVDSSKLKSGWRQKRKAKKLARNQKWAKRPKPLRILRNMFRYGKFAVFAMLAYFIISIIIAQSNIIDRGGDGSLALQDNIQPSQLRSEGDGRVNIMLLGVGGENHPGGNLADSIIIASIDPFANELAMLSIPRDMYVEIPGYYSTRINAAHAFGEDDPTLENGGITLMQETLEETLGINIHYYARADFSGFQQAVDNVGGITVNLDEAVYDPNFDGEYGYNALNLSAGENTLDGDTALLLARSRNATGLGYGTGNDFDRAENQRKILLALKDKILSLETFSNPVTLSNLLRTASGSARTNIGVGEMLKLREIFANISDDKVISFGLNTEADNYLTPSTIDGASVLLPKAGDYSEIKLFVRELFVDGFVKQESPLIDVYNGSVQAGRASETADELASYGYSINIVGNAPSQDYKKTVIYDLSDGEKPYTKELISNRFEVAMRPASEVPPELAVTEADFVIIVGPYEDPQNNPNF